LTKSLISSFPTERFILGIETSCDDSSISILNNKYQDVITITQAHLECLQPYQGIMPEVASREHCRYVPLLLSQIEKKIPLKMIDAIAITAGPGLAGSLLTGHACARTLHALLDIPLIPIHHLEGHLCAIFIEDPSPIVWPALGLLVSGGHTQLIEMEKPFSYKIIGQTRDDAAGEAFDKIAKSIGLPYPGGPALSKLAANSTYSELFSIPLINDKTTLDFSFSGLKTQATRSPLKDELPMEDYCAMVENTIVEALYEKCSLALQSLPETKTIIVSGGVASNPSLRKKMLKLAQKHQCILRIPSPKYCTDNGTMIAAAANFQIEHNGPALTRLMGTYPQWILGLEPTNIR